MRTYQRKTTRAAVPLDQLKIAANAVSNNGKSVRAAANEFGVPRMTLVRFIKKSSSQEHPTMGYAAPRKVFNEEQEQGLKDYLLKTSDIYYGLTPKNVRTLAYDCAIKFGITFPISWNSNKMAGKDWLTGFLKRSTELSIRKPEATSLGRATSFNKTNVDNFFDKLATVMDKSEFTASQIWNIDETGVSTVCKPSKIVAAKGKRNIGSVTSAERGTNVTLIVAVSASGITIPPMFIFPRKKYKDHFVLGGPPDCIGVGNASGWSSDVEFYIFMEHFIKHVKPSVECPILLLLDNHSSHLSIKTLDLAKSNGVVMLSFPPHCSHRLQPLDVSVFAPFKRYLSAAQDGWLRSNPGRTMTIYNIPSVVAESLPLATTGLNIINGFKKSGIFPYNREIFTSSDFAPSYVTDRPDDLTTPTVPHSSTPLHTELDVTVNVDDSPKPSTSRGTSAFSPEAVLPFPKAGPRKQAKLGKKKRRAAILTDTPEKDALADEQMTRQKKIPKRVEKKKKKQVKKKVLQEYSSEEEQECYCLVCLKAYSDSLPGEEWIQCHTCRQWAHTRCATNSGVMYVCVNCDSD